VVIWRRYSVSKANADLDQPRRRRYLEPQCDREGSSFQWADDSCQGQQIVTPDIEATLFLGVDLLSGNRSHNVPQMAQQGRLSKGMS